MDDADMVESVEVETPSAVNAAMEARLDAWQLRALASWPTSTVIVPGSQVASGAIAARALGLAHPAGHDY